MATSFTVNKADLEFILKQIKIAEATSIGYTATPVSIVQAIMNAYGLKASDAAIAPYGLRTVDGSFNSLIPGQDKFGAADTLFPRLTDPVYRNEQDETPFVGVTNTNYGTGGSVVDSDPRIISNLIVDMSINNPGAVSAFLNNPLAVEYYTQKYGYEPTAAHHPDLTNEDLQVIPNQSPDIGLSPGFNAWMTFFGQFFDHGLDLVTKGNNGTIYIPLQPDDPLIAGADGIFGNGDDLAPHLRFMTLTRATPTMVDPDGAGPLPAVAQHENTTTSFVDQNQTYTSHPSHQVFLREYVKDANDHAVSTGRLLDGSAESGSVTGAIGNWADVKAQALEMLGIRLSDFDVHNVPLLLTDQYGKFIPGPNGYAQMVMQADAAHGNMPWLKEGTAAGITTEGSISTNHAFLNDIAHNATPSANGLVDHDRNPATAPVAMTADDDTIAGNEILPNEFGVNTTYDDELLNAHFVTGDGRGNENVALTAVHSIFHSEHNRLVEVNKTTILQSGDLAFINEWLVNDITTLPTTQEQIDDLVWDGERLFQTARFGTEMQYQHLVFEEFARRIQPMVDPFIFNTSPDVDPSIVAEFAHTVYRFGHSMLTGTVDRLDNNLDPLNPSDPNSVDGQQTLLAMFLNPTAYVASGATLDEINANLIRGLTRDVGNAIDEFIVTDVRSNLLGLPLDLGALNIARGRDTGIPSLNQAREQLYNDTGLADLKPYDSWADFALNIKNPTSIINFIAAYGTHTSITSQTTLAGKRAAAEELVLGVDGSDADTTVAADRLDFLNARNAYATGRGGLDLVDLWIGGLAEKNPEFGGMLGTTFNYVFEFQMEALQFGDRMYYLTRTQGLNFLNQLEPNSFADLVMRNTALGDEYSTHVNGQLFVTPDHIIELDRGIAQEDYNGAAAGNDPMWDGSNPVVEAILGPKVVRDYTGSTVADGNHDVGGYLRVLGGEHYVLGGTEGNDRIYGDSGIDTLWGDGGNDYLNGGTESDDVFGGEGDDFIEDPFGDDVLRGNQGNDVITSARGADLMFGGEGVDLILVGQDASEVFGGTETDFILGGAGKDFLLGNEGDDWIEGGAGFDTIAGENSELFFNSPIIGHDVMFGHGDEQDYDAESGDDIMGSGPSVYRYEGMFGFDWGIAKFDESQIRFDLQIPIFTTIPEDVLRDRFDQVEALSGWKNDDILDGDDRGHSGGSSSPDSTPVELFTDHTLDAAGIDRIDGLRELLGLTGAPNASFKNGNILIGGDGNDMIRGRGGFDVIDGDSWLNVRIKIVHNGITYSAESLTTDTTVAGPYAGKVFNTNPDGSANFDSPAFGGASLTSLLLNRTINPGEMSIIREILDGDLDNSSIDTAVFQGGDLEYEIEGTRIVYDQTTGEALRRVNIGAPDNSTAPLNIRDVNGDGFITVRDLDDGLVAAPGRVGGLTVSRGALTDDTDKLVNIERLQFADKTLTVGLTSANSLATGTVTISDPSPFDHDGNPATSGVVSPIVGQVLTATLSNFADADGIPIDPATGMPVGLTFEWQTTEAGNDGGWATISTGLTYTVRPVDPAHVLRAVAVFKDSEGVTERIASGQTDNVTAPFFVNENSLTGTVVAPTIPFSLDYDPLGFGGTGVTDGDVVQLTHVISPGHDAGGRFTIVNAGTAAAPVYQLQVANGGPQMLNYEAGVHTPANQSHQFVDNQYQIVIDTYTDTIANGGVLMAQRQFTIFLNDVTGEITDVAPTLDLHADLTTTTTTPGSYVDNFNSASFSNSNGAASWTATPWVETSDSGGVSSGQIQLDNGTNQLQFLSGDGATITRSVNLSGRTSATLSFDYEVNDLEAAKNLRVEAFNTTTSSWEEIGSFLGTNTGGGNTASGTFSIGLSAAQIGATSAIRLRAEGNWTGNDSVSIDNLTVSSSGFYADSFNSASFSNSNGAASWAATPWVETGDSGGVSSGQIQLDNGTNQLQFLSGDGATIARSVNLSGRTSATLSFDYEVNDLEAGENLRVEAFNTTTSSWEQIGSFLGTNTGGGNTASGTFSIGLSAAQIGATSAIRLRAEGNWTGNDSVSIDNLRIEPATSTTTTVPGTPGTGYTTSFTEGGAAVAIASNPAVADADNTTLMGATVKLTNAQAGDVLSIQGTLPAGMSASFGPAVSGVVTMYLSGSGPISKADLQTAIGQLRFSNTNDNPNPMPAATPRTIEVTVNDGEKESIIATATVHVTGVDDAPNANNDAIITSAAVGTAFLVPEWVLLANDTDPDSTLDITLISSQTGLAASLATNPGSITVTDTGAADGSFSYTAAGGALTDMATVTVDTVASTVTTTYAENFNSTSYTNDDGAWTDNWTENDPGNDNDIFITGGNPSRLQFDDGIDGGEWISRAVNLDGATGATLSFSYEDDNLGAGQNIVVEAWNAVTNSWTAVGTTATLGSTTGNGSGNFSASLSTNQIGAASAIRFRAEGNWDNGDNFFIDDVSVTFTTPASINGGSGGEILIGDVNGSTFDGGTGNDIVLAGAGNDTVIWNANGNGSTDGRDFVDGGIGSDLFDVNTRAGTDESYRVYTVAAALSGPNAIIGLTTADLKPGTEIIITRTTGGGPVDVASIIAELDNVEEIRIGTQNADPTNGSAGSGDTVAIFGDFSTTSLALSTITIDGEAGDDTIDISSLTSAHRIVFRSNGGNDTIIGTLRPQDVIELPAGSNPADYETTENEDGTTTYASPTHSVTYVSDGTPQIRVSGSNTGDEEDDETENEGNDPPGSNDDNVTLPGDIRNGTALADVLTGTSGDDTIAGLAGDDTVAGGAGDDVIRGDDGNDLLNGQAGRDMVSGGAGNDDILGGEGADMLYGDQGNDRILAGEGHDLVNAGAGNDTVFGGAGSDIVVAEAGDGDDTYYGDEMNGGAGSDTLDMAAITANITADLGTGFMGRGSASSSQSGNDTLWNIENIVTGSGNDTITASAAVNVMDGGAGNDTYRFLSAVDANGDTIASFQPGDKLDLTAIDAVSGTSGNQNFTLVTGSAFTGAGQVMVTYESREDGDYTVVHGNTDSDTTSEFSVSIKGTHDLNNGNFGL